MPTFPTLSKNPEYPLKQSKNVEVIKSTFEGGYVLTRPKHTRARGVWEVIYSLMSQADMNSLSGFIDSVSGAVNSFDWTHPQSSNVHTVRFMERPEFSNDYPSLWSTRFTLEEV